MPAEFVTSPVTVTVEAELKTLLLLNVSALTVPLAVNNPVLPMSVAEILKPPSTVTVAAFDNVVIPVKLPPVTSRVAVPVLVKVLLPIKLPVTLKSPAPWFRITPLNAPSALTMPSFTIPPVTVEVPAPVLSMVRVELALLSTAEPVEFNVPATVIVPSLLSMESASSVKVAATSTAEAEVELFTRLANVSSPFTSKMPAPLRVTASLAAIVPPSVEKVPPAMLMTLVEVSMLPAPVAASVPPLTTVTLAAFTIVPVRFVVAVSTLTAPGPSKVPTIEPPLSVCAPAEVIVVPVASAPPVCENVAAESVPPP